MTEEILERITGTWVHSSDDDLSPFFNVVGASDAEKEYMLTSKPKLMFSVEGDTVKTTNMPHPDSHPEINAACDFKLNDEFQFEPRGLVLKIKVTVENGKMVQHVTPIDSHIRPHSIQLSTNEAGNLIQTYCVHDEVLGKEVTGCRTFTKQ